MLKKLSFILTKKEKVFLIYILLLVMAGSALELLAVAIFSPYIEIITGAGQTNTGGLSSLILGLLSNFEDVNDSRKYIVSLSFIIILIYVTKNLFLSYEKNTVYKYSYNMQHRVANKLLSSYMAMPYTFHLKTNPAELVRSVVSDADRFAKVIIHVMELIMEIIVCVILGVYLVFVSPIITGVIACLLAFALLAYFKLAKKRLRLLGKKKQKLEALIYKNINQALGGIKETKILERDEYFVNEFSNALNGNLNILRISRLMASLPKYFIEALCITGLMIAVIIMMLVDGSDASRFVPQIAVFATAAFRLMPSVGRINEHMAAIDGGDASVELIYKDLKNVSEIVRTEQAHDNKAEKLEFEKIRLDGVSYKYPDAEDYVFSNVNFEIERGKTVAFIGESGAGKTTLADVILGLLAPVEGKVCADTSDIYENMSGWHKNIGYIPQFIYLSDDTIRNNIAFGITPDEIDEKKIETAVEKAKLSEFIGTLPDGLDTVVGERGARLSGGQRQRIGIARALYHDPEILVMDEATSALDNETETAVMESIDGLHGSKTIIIIAHRLSTLRNADTILKVEKGKVVEKSKEEVLKI